MTSASGAILDHVAGLMKKSEQEYAAPCPWCEGDDRFVVWPFKGTGGRYYCRKCGQKGDCIDLLRERGMSFQEAQKACGGAPCDLDFPELRRIRNNRSSQAFVNREVWNNSAQAFLESLKNEGQANLQAFLLSRHLSYETAAHFSLRWNPQDRFFSAKLWGLEGDKKQVIPAGLVIPVHNNGKIVALVVRCADTSRGPRYWQVRGSGLECFALGDPGKPVLIVESHLDAILIWQEASDKVSVISMNGTGRPLDHFSRSLVTSSTRLLISTDFDEKKNGETGAGQGAFFRLKREHPQAEYFPVPIGKDPGEMVVLGVSIRDWLAIALPEPKRCSLKLPTGYPGSAESVESWLTKHPHLVPCPKASTPWYWIYRTQCSSCPGHIHCIKDWTPNSHAVI